MLQRDDRSLLAQFFFADDALNMVAAELDSFDGRKDPERCSTLVNQLRHAQVCSLFNVFSSTTSSSPSFSASLESQDQPWWQKSAIVEIIST